MDILLIAAIIFIALIALGYPLVNARRYQYAGGGRGNAQLENLENARTQVLDALRDLQFDHATGKLTDGDYDALHSQYEMQAARIFQQLDAIAGAPSGAARHVCPRCRAAIQATDKFCVKCGSKL